MGVWVRNAETQFQALCGQGRISLLGGPIGLNMSQAPSIMTSRLWTIKIYCLKSSILESEWPRHKPSLPTFFPFFLFLSLPLCYMLRFVSLPNKRIYIYIYIYIYNYYIL